MNENINNTKEEELTKDMKDDLSVNDDLKENEKDLNNEDKKNEDEIVQEETKKEKISNPKYITVKWGDTLKTIAKKNKMTVDELCKLNRISKNNSVFVGNQLRVK